MVQTFFVIDISLKGNRISAKLCLQTNFEYFSEWCSVSAVTEDIIPTNKPIKKKTLRKM